MPELIGAVARTRKTAASALAQVVTSLDGKSEAEIHDGLVHKLGSRSELYPTGWYDPPPGGASVLIGTERMGFDSIRKQDFWPRTDIRYDKETPAMLYVSPVDRSTQMIGDIAFTVYQGTSSELQAHFRKGLDAILDIAGQAEAGMSFDTLHAVGVETVKRHGLEHARIATITPGAGESNFGHSVPWSDGEAAPGQLPIEDLKEDIRVARRFISPGDQYIIPNTGAFTVESRLVNPKRRDLPNVYFHVIVALQDGQRKILTDFDEIFRAAGMSYLL